MNREEPGARMQSFKDLLVWQKAMEVAVDIYDLTASYPAETRKTVRSVPYNMAEGKSRLSPREFRQFVSIAKGSAGELHTRRLLAHRLKNIPSSRPVGVEGRIDEIGRMLWGLERSLS